MENEEKEYFTGVREITEFPDGPAPATEEVIEETTETTEDAPVVEEENIEDDYIPTVDEYNAIKEELEQLKANPPAKEIEKEVVKYTTDPILIEAANNYINALPDPATMSIGDLLIAKVQRENPAARTKDHVQRILENKGLKVDFDIPENLGLDEIDFDLARAEGEAFRVNLVAQRNEEIEKVKKALSSPGAPTEQISQDDYNNLIVNYVEEKVKSYTPQALKVEIPGFTPPALDGTAMKDKFYSSTSEQVPWIPDATTGQLLPNWDLFTELERLRAIESSIPAMLDAAKRIAPKEAIAAVKQTLRGGKGVEARSPHAGQGSEMKIGGQNVMAIREVNN